MGTVRTTANLGHCADGEWLADDSQPAALDGHGRQTVRFSRSVTGDRRTGCFWRWFGDYLR
jgi:hypothetical protein